MRLSSTAHLEEILHALTLQQLSYSTRNLHQRSINSQTGSHYIQVYTYMDRGFLLPVSTV